MTEAIDLLKACRPFVSRAALQFTDVPDDLDPTFYHTLSAEGDRATRDRYVGLLNRIDNCVNSPPEDTDGD